MRILIVSQYFFPETGATSNRVYSLAKKFQDEGHKVRVIGEKPNHPKGIFFDGYEKGLFIDEKYNDVPITYSWVYTRPQKGFIGRILFYLSFMITAIFASLRRRRAYDIVLASSPPLFVGISGWAIAKIKGAKFVFDVRDLWPEVAVKMGELSNTFAIKIAEGIEHFLYQNADLITTVTSPFKISISNKEIEKGKIEVITNGTDPEVFDSPKTMQELRQKLGLGEGFIVSYIGNLGLAQGLDHIIQAAENLEKQGINDIKVLFVGDGPKKKELMEAVEVRELFNVSFVDRVPLDKAAEYMNASDSLLVPLADDPIYKQFIPSKLFDSMAASKPVLLSVDGESRKILEEAGAGLYYKAENAEELVNKIKWLKKNRDKAKKMGQEGRRYVVDHYSREVQAHRMLDSFKKLFNIEQ